MYTNIYCSYPYEIVYFIAKSTPLLFSRFGGFLTVSFFPFFLIFLGSECGMPFQSGKKYLSCFLSVLTSKTDSDKPDSHVIFSFSSMVAFGLTLFASFAVFAMQAANSA